MMQRAALQKWVVFSLRVLIEADNGVYLNGDARGTGPPEDTLLHSGIKSCKMISPFPDLPINQFM